MDSLKEKIVEKLDSLPEMALQEVLEFLDFVIWRDRNREKSSLSVVEDDLREEQDTAWLEMDLSNLESYDAYDWQPGEMSEGLPVKYVPGMGVVIVEK
ncbi:hypothetical protein [Microseira wollei]|uniref:DUF2281 domain-containing protein n=1 Tax=Microseira wollei NIES-4236 TaxID=2530354 RepID=A0AAV3XDL4_9CYAN|nr:hypothetical protein [Microseira wollei]GET39496.1 hypothetical protein MiSe_42650 [Microseira wollei NIES-4236]